MVSNYTFSLTKHNPFSLSEKKRKRKTLANNVLLWVSLCICICEKMIRDRIFKTVPGSYMTCKVQQQEVKSQVDCAVWCLLTLAFDRIYFCIIVVNTWMHNMQLLLLREVSQSEQWKQKLESWNDSCWNIWYNISNHKIQPRCHHFWTFECRHNILYLQSSHRR